MLRRDSIMQHVARTGHMRCRAAGEIRPESVSVCSVQCSSFSFSIPPILRMGTEVTN